MSDLERDPGKLQEESRDLGFGSVVSKETHRRLLNRDGTFNVRRHGLGWFTAISPYQAMLGISWLKFHSIVIAAYLLTNLLFAFGYLLCGKGALVGSDAGNFGTHFMRAFSFSVETLSTIGYGHLSPESFAANVLVTAEALVGLMGFAIVTGLLFSRFSRPSLSVRFSDNALVTPYRDITAFVFRIVNLRKSEIIELGARVVLSRIEEEADGSSARRFYNLDLERSKVPFFPLSWTVTHPIDEGSPLRGWDEERLIRSEAEFLILLTGIDETFSQTLHARSSYKADEVVFGAKFTRIFEREGPNDPLSLDIRRLHEFERVP